MRIALVHSYYSSRQPSGENIAVDSQIKLLSESGYNVLSVARHTDRLEVSRTYPMKAGWAVATGIGASPLRALRRFRPDVVHVHNLFPNWGTRWISKWSGPVVATLHNYRPLCAAGTLYRNGEACTICPDGDPWGGVRHRCYRSSATASAAIALRNRRGLESDPLLRRADRLILLSERAKRTFTQYGVDPKRMVILPNFVDDPSAGHPQKVPTNGRWLLVGRLSPEKGVEELLAAWPQHERLDVIGDGPLADSLHRHAGGDVAFLGARTRIQVAAAMPAYLGLIFPSRWQEALPTVVLEALAAGLPVAALQGSSAADVVETLSCGVVVEADYGWAAALACLRASRSALSDRARAGYEANFKPSSWLDEMTRTYEELLNVGHL